MSIRLAVLVDWPNGNTPWICMASLWNSDVRREPDCFMLRGIAPHPDVAANMTIKVALDKGAEELFFICADQGVPRNVLARMRSHDADIVGALTASRQNNHPWLIYNFGPDGHATPIITDAPAQRVDYVGPGCMLVKASVFRTLPQPWWDTRVSEDGTSVTSSSDFSFFRKAKEHGMRVFVDATLESPHLHDVVLNARSLHRKAPFIVETLGG